MTEWPEGRARQLCVANLARAYREKPHSTTSGTMADPPSHPPQTPYKATNQSVADPNQAAPSPESSPAPDAPAALLFHSTRRV
eukprot:scaffold14920_cov78-Cyclotella_meneghiniana.AAC.2